MLANSTNETGNLSRSFVKSGSIPALKLDVFVPMNFLSHQFLILVLMLLAMLLQFQVIWKIESSLMEYSPVAVASLMFVPHGIRAIAAVLSGAGAFAPIFLAHRITDLTIG
jgi:hypothetical protein